MDFTVKVSKTIKSGACFRGWVGFAQFDECITNIEIEETAKVIMHSLTAMLYDKYGIDLMSGDYKHMFQMLKNYVVETNLVRDDILDIQYEKHNGIRF